MPAAAEASPVERKPQGCGSLRNYTLALRRFLKLQYHMWPCSRIAFSYVTPRDRVQPEGSRVVVWSFYFCLFVCLCLFFPLDVNKDYCFKPAPGLNQRGRADGLRLWFLVSPPDFGPEKRPGPFVGICIFRELWCQGSSGRETVRLLHHWNKQRVNCRSIVALTRCSVSLWIFGE